MEDTDMPQPACRIAAQVTATFLALLVAGLAAAASASASGRHYGLIISTAATRHVSFHKGVFEPTANHATLNIDDLENALAGGNVVVTTGNGSGGSHYGDLHIEIAGITWSSSYSLSLDAFHSIFVDEPVVDAGTGALTLTTNDGGTGGEMLYGPGGSFSISNTSDALTINGQAYALVQGLPDLASDVAANPAGFYALAGSYDAQGKTYQQSPIATTLTGTVEGLGNTISHLDIEDTTRMDDAGLFTIVGPTGSVQDLRVSIKVNIEEPASAGAMAANNYGQLIDDSVHAVLRTTYAASSSLGGLVGANSGTILRCNADATINALEDSSVGGLVGSDVGGTIVESFALGRLYSGQSALGGLVGSTSQTSIANSYAATTADDQDGDAGGLVGVNGDTQGHNGQIASSYASGRVSGKRHGDGVHGGLIGIDNSTAGSVTGSYWDTSTSGITNLSQGAGSPPNDPGITGESSSQLASGLPAGFDSSIWRESTSINTGLPYLIANPPPQ
jgi:hypothetical protein